MIEKNKILNLVAFCILMENDDGILGKSPNYILEKFEKYCRDTSETKWMFGLDVDNLRKLKKWAEKWFNIDLEKEIEEYYEMEEKESKGKAKYEEQQRAESEWLAQKEKEEYETGRYYEELPF